MFLRMREHPCHRQAEEVTHGYSTNWYAICAKHMRATASKVSTFVDPLALCRRPDVQSPSVQSRKNPVKCRSLTQLREMPRRQV